MKRQREVEVRELFGPSTPDERAVYLEARVGGFGAEILFSGEVEGECGAVLGTCSIHLPRAVHAAALESLARSLRLALEREEQRALALPPAEETQPRNHEGGRG